MFNLICKIEITTAEDSKKISFDYVNNIEVQTSIRNLTDTATVKLPRKMHKGDRPLTEFINRGDEITIQAGYERYDIQTLFTGYITDIENNQPVVLKCENEMRPLKLIDVPAQDIEKFDIEVFIKEHAPKVEVVTIGDVSFGSMNFDQEMNLAQALDKVIQKYPYVKVYFQDGKLHVVQETASYAEREPIVFDPMRNMISDNLTYIREEDVKIGIKAVSILHDNSKLEAYAPKETEDGCGQRQCFKPECKTQEELQDFADKTVAEQKTSKMTGSFKAFGIPFVRKGDNVQLKDNDCPERHNKRFVVEAVDYSFGTGGYRQNIKLGDQL